MTEQYPPSPPARDPGLVAKITKWLTSFFEILESRTNAAAFVGLVGYLLARGGIEIDNEAATTAVQAAAAQVSDGRPLTAADIAVFVTTLFVLYFRSNARWRK